MINRMYFAFTYLICFSPNYKKKKKTPSGQKTRR